MSGRGLRLLNFHFTFLEDFDHVAHTRESELPVLNTFTGHRMNYPNCWLLAMTSLMSLSLGPAMAISLPGHGMVIVDAVPNGQTSSRTSRCHFLIFLSQQMCSYDMTIHYCLTLRKDELAKFIPIVLRLGTPSSVIPPGYRSSPHSYKRQLGQRVADQSVR